MSPIRDTDGTAPAELAACRLWEARLERELADLREIIEGLQCCIDTRTDAERERDKRVQETATVTVAASSDGAQEDNGVYWVYNTVPS
jgi:hypothetical protein